MTLARTAIVKPGLVQEQVAVLSTSKEDLPPIPQHQLQTKGVGGGRGGGGGAAGDRGGRGGGGGGKAGRGAAGIGYPGGPGNAPQGNRSDGPESNRLAPQSSFADSPPKRAGKAVAGGKRTTAAEAALEEAGNRVSHLERSLRFLKNQHTEVLQALHAEIDELKRKNKDLHIRLIVRQRGGGGEGDSPRSIEAAGIGGNGLLQVAGGGSPASRRPSVVDLRRAGFSPTSLEAEAKIALLEEEVKDLKGQLRESRSRYMTLSNKHENLQRGEEKLQELLAEKELEISKMSDRLDLLESVTFSEDPAEAEAEAEAAVEAAEAANINVSVEEISVTNASLTEPLLVGGELDTERERVSELPVDTPRTEDTLALNLHSFAGGGGGGGMRSGWSEDPLRRVGSLDTTTMSTTAIARGAFAETSFRSEGGDPPAERGREGLVGRKFLKSVSPKKGLGGGGVSGAVGGGVKGGGGGGGGRDGGGGGRGAPPPNKEVKDVDELRSDDNLIHVGEIKATILPLQVFPVDGARGRVPTLQECAVISRHLKRVADERLGELRKLKADLRELLDSNKWSPDAFLLARAYVMDLTREAAASTTREAAAAQPSTSLPRIELRQRTKRVPSDAYVPVKEEMTLPALNQAMPGNKAAERKRRTQILQRARLHHKAKVPEASGM